jgi:SAM-dependent methyltransferase
MPRSVVRPYKLLAEHYDQLFGFARSWGEFARTNLLANVFPKIGSACDLACGTGTAALEIARRGLKVYAVDLSPTMCRLARRKARAAGLPLQVIQADMRNFRLPEKVGLVICEFDAINHIPRRKDLVAVTRAVARALQPGGHFYFDVNTRLSFEKIWPLTWWLEKPGVVLVMRGGYDKPSGKAFANAEWFIREGNLWRRHHEYVEQVCWTADEIRDALHAAGFRSIRQWDAAPFFKDDPFVRPGYRTFYLARK